MSLLNLANQIQSNSSKVWNGKEAIATKITEKGGQVYYDTNEDGTQATYLKFQNLVDGIDTIPGGIPGGSSTLLSPQCHQTAIDGYNLSNNGHLKVKLGQVADETYDRSYLVVREGNNIVFPIQENELIEVGKNAESYEILGTSRTKKYSIMAISKDTSGNYQTVIEKNQIKGVSGVSINLEGKYIEAILPEALQETTSINAILTKKGKLFISSNSTDIPGLWTFNIEIKSFQKVDDTGCAWLGLFEGETRTFVFCGNKILLVNDNETYTDCTYSGMDLRKNLELFIETSHNDFFITTIGGYRIAKFDDVTNKFVNYSALQPSGNYPIRKMLEVNDGDVMFFSEYNQSVHYYERATATSSTITNMVGKYFTHQYINAHLLITLQTGNSDYSTGFTYKFVNKSNFTKASDYVYCNLKLDCKYVITTNGNCYWNYSNTKKLNIETMIFEDTPLSTNGISLHGLIQADNGNIYTIHSPNNYIKNLVLVDEINGTIETISGIDLNSISYPVMLNEFKVSTNKYIFEFYYYDSDNSLCKSKEAIFDVINNLFLYVDSTFENSNILSFEKMNENVIIGYGDYNYQATQSYYTGTYVRVFDLLNNTKKTISSYSRFYKNDDVIYLYPIRSSNTYVKKVNVDGTVTDTTIKTNGYMYNGMCRDGNSNVKKIYKNETEVGDCAGEYTGTPMSNNGFNSFMFDITSGTNRILFTY